MQCLEDIYKDFLRYNFIYDVAFLGSQVWKMRPAYLCNEVFLNVSDGKLKNRLLTINLKSI